jgi:hypothetical protein
MNYVSEEREKESCEFILPYAFITWRKKTLRLLYPSNTFFSLTAPFAIIYYKL